MKTTLDNRAANKLLEEATHRVLHRDLPADPDERDAEFQRRAQDVNNTTLAILEELGGDGRVKLNFFGRENAELEQQVFAWVLNHATKPYMQKLLPHIRPEFFDSYHGHKLVKLVQTLNEKHGIVPARSYLLKTLSENMTEDELEHYDEFVKWVNAKPDPSVYDYFTDTDTGLLAQLKQKAYERVLMTGELQAFLADKEYDNLDRAFQCCFPEPDKANVISLKGDIDAILAKDSIESIGVGFHAIDAAMHEHGAARGEVFTWMANTGVGKTTLMLNCTRHALSKGLNVAYIVLEGTNKAVGQRLASLISNQPTRTLHEHTALAKRAVEATQGEVRLIQPTDEVWSTRHIARKMDFMRTTEGFIPDVIIIDYAKFLKASSVSKSDPEYVKLAKVMDDVKRLALETDTLVITAQQANREGEDQATVGLKHAAGSYDALQPCDYVVSINQTVQEAQRNELRLAINKNRHGREQLFVQCTINRASGLVEQK